MLWLWLEQKTSQDMKDTQNEGPKVGRPIVKQHTFNWEAEDKYNELKNLRLEVNNIFKSYNTPQTEKQ